MARRIPQQFSITRAKDTTVHSSAGLKKAVQWSLPADVAADKEQWQREAYLMNRIFGQVGKVNHLTSVTVAACDMKPVWVDPVTSDEFELDDLLRMDPNDSEFDSKVLAQAQAVKRVDDAFLPPIGGKAELLRTAALNLRIGGEAFLTATPTVESAPAGDSPELVWEFLSPLELKQDRIGALIRDQTGHRSLSISDGKLVDGTYIARVWQSDPEHSELPDCLLRKALPDCRQYIQLREVIDAAIQSRLAAGALLVDESLSFGPPDEAADPDSDENGDPLTLDLLDHMSAPIEDRSSAAGLVPLVLRGDGEQLKNVRMLDLSNDGRNLEQLQGQRREVLMSVGMILDAPPEMMTGRGELNHWCQRDSARVLTRRGWVGIDDFEAGDEVFSVDHGTGLAEWRPSVGVYRAPVVDEPMIRIEAKSVRGRVTHESLTTPNHSWPVVRDGERLTVRADEVRAGDLLMLAAPSVGLPSSAKWSDAFVQLVAWYSADGTQIGTTPQVRIGKSHVQNPGKVAELRKIFTELFGPEHEGSIPHELRGDGHERWTTLVEDRGMTLFCPNRAAAAALLEVVPGKDKVVPVEFVQSLTASQLALFIEAWLDSDGDDTRSAWREVGQRVAARLDALEMACVLLGKATARTVRMTGGFGEPQPQHFLCIRSMPTATVSQVEEKTYTGRVWCPTVPPHHTVLSEDGGATYFTGNTGFAVDTDFSSKHVIPLLQLIASFSTSGMLQPMLVEYEGMDPADAASWVYRADASAITAKADKGVTFIRLYDRKVISESALRQANGASEADAPSPEERRDRMIVELVGANAAYAPLLHLISGLEDLDLSVLGPPAAGGGGSDRVPTGQGPNGPSGPSGPSGPRPRGPADPSGDGVGGDSPQSGDGPPTDPQQNLPGDGMPSSGAASMIGLLRGEADAAMDRALERAGARAVSRLSAKKLPQADRLRSRPKSEALSLLSAEDFVALGTTFDALLPTSEWEDFARKASGLVRDWVVATIGRNGSVSAEVSRSIGDDLAARLHVLAAYDRGMRSYEDGLKVPAELIVGALEAIGPVVRW